MWPVSRMSTCVAVCVCVDHDHCFLAFSCFDCSVAWQSVPGANVFTAPVMLCDAVNRGDLLRLVPTRVCVLRNVTPRCSLMERDDLVEPRLQ